MANVRPSGPSGSVCDSVARRPATLLKNIWLEPSNGVQELSPIAFLAMESDTSQAESHKRCAPLSIALSRICLCQKRIDCHVITLCRGGTRNSRYRWREKQCVFSGYTGGSGRYSLQDAHCTCFPTYLSHNAICFLNNEHLAASVDIGNHVT